MADRLGVLISPNTQAQLAARPTANLAAYDAYLRSIALDAADPATLRRSLAAAEQAVALDPAFAGAWARVSSQHSRLYARATPTPLNAIAARQAADRAVSLDPASSDAYYALTNYHQFVTHELKAARTAIETAVRLAPSSSLAIGGLGSVEADMGKWTSGLEHARRAVALDPRSPGAAARLSICSSAFVGMARLALRSSEDSRSYRATFSCSAIIW